MERLLRLKGTWVASLFSTVRQAALFIGLFVLLPAQAQQRHEFTHLQMGTLFRIVLYAADSTQAQEAAAAAFRRIDTLNAILSDYRQDSELSRLSRAAGSRLWVSVSPDLWHILRISHKASLKSNGAFDITIGPVVQLWRRARRQHELPSEEALKKAQAAVDYRYIQYAFSKKAVCLQHSGMRLDPGGIGKGYAVDEALQVLQQHGIQSGLVDGGGNLAIGAAPPGKRGWQVQVGTMEKDTSHALTLTLQHAGVSTSGDQYQFVEIDGQRYSHIVNPQTGKGLVNQCTASVIARNGTTADWLSTAVSVLGAQKGLQLVRKVPKAAAYVLMPTNTGIQVYASENLKKHVARKHNDSYK